MVNGYVSLHQGIIDLLESVTNPTSAVTKNIPGVYEWAKNIVKLKKPVVASFTYYSANVTVNFNTFEMSQGYISVNFTTPYYLSDAMMLNIAVTPSDDVTTVSMVV